MYLIHTTTIRLHEFFGDAVPKYAILSHTWEDEEVTFKDMQSLELSQLRQKRGFRKIEYTCAEAHKRELRWAWVDTCCIDKSSSAELSEAINSMYAWYQRSEICFAYLSDVPDDTSPRPMRSNFRLSRWFSRGWTLQELVAPAQVIFYGANWSFIGDKLLLCIVLEDTTRVPHDLLLGQKGLNHFSIAQRMARASKRKTTRVEDTAYCSLGLCDINMPLLYGEGVKAFQRLQEEIIKQTDDQSLFTWTVEPFSPMSWTLASVLATSPADFARSSQIHRLHEELGDPSVVTKKGVQIHAPLIPIRSVAIEKLPGYSRHSFLPGRTLFRMPLNCVLRQERVCLTVMQINSATLLSRAPGATNTPEKSLTGSMFVRFLLPTWYTEQDRPEFWDLGHFDKFFLRTNLKLLGENGFFQFRAMTCKNWHVVEIHLDYRNEAVRMLDIPTVNELGAMTTSGFVYIPPSPWLQPSHNVHLHYYYPSKDYHFKRLAENSIAKMKFLKIEGPQGCPPLYLVCGITQDPVSATYGRTEPQSEPREGVLAEPYIFCNLLPHLEQSKLSEYEFLFFQPKGCIGRLVVLKARHGRTAVSVELYRDKGLGSPEVQNRAELPYSVPGGPSPHFIFDINARTADDSAQSSDDSLDSHQPYPYLDNNGGGSDTGLGQREIADGDATYRDSSKSSLDLSSESRPRASSHTACSTMYEAEDYWCDIYTDDLDGPLRFREKYRVQW